MRTLTIFALFFTTLLFNLAEVTRADDYEHYIRQIQMPTAEEWDIDGIDLSGSRPSHWPINPSGARFELWTAKANPLTSYLLDTTYVNSYIPSAKVEITSADPYDVIPRTRCDQPFEVTITVGGMSTDPSAPEPAKSVKLLRHVQSYPGNGNGNNIDRGQATLYSQGSLNSNGTHTLTYAVTAIPGGDRTKVRGEERFSVFSLEDFQAPESQLTAEFIQIWPMTDISVSGISNGDKITGTAPKVTVDLDDLYPDSWTYAQVYEGQPQLGTEGTLVPGTSILVDASTPKDEKMRIKDWDKSIPTDGTWTLEILTATPFGTDRLSYTTFEVDRTLEINGAVTSVE